MTVGELLDCLREIEELEDELARIKHVKQNLDTYNAERRIKKIEELLAYYRSHEIEK